jgi:hypothetical protein
VVREYRIVYQQVTAPFQIVNGTPVGWRWAVALPGRFVIWRRGPMGAIAEVKKGLLDAGITESVVFPDLDGVGRELAQRWDARR